MDQLGSSHRSWCDKRVLCRRGSWGIGGEGQDTQLGSE
jgi:hypothetical protein